jgi:type III pantothenate kinase
MKPDVVVDIGNSRMKWGLLSDPRSRGGNQAQRIQELATLPLDDADAWAVQWAQWQLFGPALWVVASVNTAAEQRFLQWLQHRQERGHAGRIELISNYDRLRLCVAVDEPQRVGLDRLLNAVAANRLREGRAAIIVDAGSAVTVDWVDASGSFRGGVIFPGLRLMAKALHDYTALLPFVEVPKKPAPLGDSTTTAIQSGVYYAAAGAIDTHIRLLDEANCEPAIVFLTGGDAHVLYSAVTRQVILWPEMTLEGIRIAAEGMP